MINTYVAELTSQERVFHESPFATLWLLYVDTVSLLRTLRISSSLRLSTIPL